MIDRTQFANELKDPAVRRLFMTMMMAEVGSYGPQARAAWAETVFNRAASQNRSLKTLLAGQRSYWQPYRDGGFARAQKALGANPQLVEKMEQGLIEASRGSNYTNGGTHNYQTDDTGMLERKFHADRGSIVNIGGETFYRKRFPNEQKWFENTILKKNPPLAPKDVPLPGLKPNAARDLADSYNLDADAKGIRQQDLAAARQGIAKPVPPPEIPVKTISEMPSGATHYEPPRNPLVPPAPQGSYDEFSQEPTPLEEIVVPPQAQPHYPANGAAMEREARLNPAGGLNPLMNLPPPKELAPTNNVPVLKPYDPYPGMLTIKTSELHNPKFDANGQVTGGDMVTGPEASKYMMEKDKEYYKKGVGYPDGDIDKPWAADVKKTRASSPFSMNALFSGQYDTNPSWAAEAFGFEWGE